MNIRTKSIRQMMKPIYNGIGFYTGVRILKYKPEGFDMLTIEIVRTKPSFWWRIKAANGEILATSEIYSSKQKAKQTAKLVQTATDWKIKDLTTKAKKK